MNQIIDCRNHFWCKIWNNFIQFCTDLSDGFCFIALLLVSGLVTYIYTVVLFLSWTLSQLFLSSCAPMPKYQLPDFSYFSMLLYSPLAHEKFRFLCHNVCVICKKTKKRINVLKQHKKTNHRHSFLLIEIREITLFTSFKLLWVVYFKSWAKKKDKSRSTVNIFLYEGSKHLRSRWGTL